MFNNLRGFLMKRIYKLLIVIGIILLLFVSTPYPCQSNKLYQVATLQSLTQGCYDGAVSVKKLLKFGNNGIGTFEGADGELILIDGVVYKGKADGKTYPAEKYELVPFANAAFIRTDKVKEASFTGGYNSLMKELNKLYPKENMPVIFKIDGEFKNVLYRNVPKQKRPYLPLKDVIKKQVIFNKESIKGSLVGFRFPAYMKNINMEGYHFSFISEDRNYGGHLLDVESGNILIKAQSLNQIDIFLPEFIKNMKFNDNN